MKLFKKLITAVTLAVTLAAFTAYGAQVTIPFAFTPSTSSDVVDYELYARDVDGTFENGRAWIVGNSLNCPQYSSECTFELVTDMDYGWYVFGLKAIDSEELYSDMSNETDPFEVKAYVPPPVKPNPPTGLRTLIQRIIAFFQSFFNRGFRIG